MEAFGQSNPFAFDMAKGFLHLTEQASVSGEGERHLAQLTKETVLLVDANPTLGVGYGGQKHFGPCYLMKREGNFHVDGVNNPPKQGLACEP